MEHNRAFPTYVVQIPDKFTVIINYGKEDDNQYHLIENVGISVGDKIKVIQPGKEIIDPKTEELLGYYDLTKAELEIVEIFDRFSVCKNVQRENVSTVGRMLSPMFAEKTEISHESLQVSENEIFGTDKLDKEIHVGDPVIFY